MSIVKKFIALFAVTLSLSSAHAVGDGISVTSGEFRIPVVELYTSEGCSSCPPADKWLRQLGQSLNRDFDAVPLAFHVDYWNYLGWADPFAKPSFTERQREVAVNNRQRSIYTPELVVDGREARGGAGIVQTIERVNAEKAEVAIALELKRSAGNRVDLQMSIDNESDQPRASAYVAVYENNIVREIGAGENRGRTLVYDFVVRHWSEPIAIRQGVNDSGVTLTFPDDWSKDNLGLAVVVLNRDTGATLQAVRTSLVDLFKS